MSETLSNLFRLNLHVLILSKVRESSMIAIKIFDHRRFQRPDQDANPHYLSCELPHLHLSSGFLGIYDISAADALDLALTKPGDSGSHGLTKNKLIPLLQKAPLPEILQHQATIFPFPAKLYLAFLWNPNLSNPNKLILNDL